jgi:hypothetical protein
MKTIGGRRPIAPRIFLSACAKGTEGACQAALSCSGFVSIQADCGMRALFCPGADLDQSGAARFIVFQEWLEQRHLRLSLRLFWQSGFMPAHKNRDISMNRNPELDTNMKQNAHKPTTPIPATRRYGLPLKFDDFLVKQRKAVSLGYAAISHRKSLSTFSEIALKRIMRWSHKVRVTVI